MEKRARNSLNLSFYNDTKNTFGYINLKKRFLYSKRVNHQQIKHVLLSSNRVEKHVLFLYNLQSLLIRIKQLNCDHKKITDL